MIPGAELIQIPNQSQVLQQAEHHTMIHETDTLYQCLLGAEHESWRPGTGASNVAIRPHDADQDHLQRQPEANQAHPKVKRR